MFVGQVFTALILDRMLSGVFSLPNLVGVFSLSQAYAYPALTDPYTTVSMNPTYISW